MLQCESDGSDLFGRAALEVCYRAFFDLSAFPIGLPEKDGVIDLLALAGFVRDYMHNYIYVTSIPICQAIISLKRIFTPAL